MSTLLFDPPEPPPLDDPTYLDHDDFPPADLLPLPPMQPPETTVTTIRRQIAEVPGARRWRNRLDVYPRALHRDMTLTELDTFVQDLIAEGNDVRFVFERYRWRIETRPVELGAAPIDLDIQRENDGQWDADEAREAHARAEECAA